ncbi:MAG: D-alanine--D-alanine ligase A, partial [Lachnospiraceae bacterium]|nr:D-alanine--D-alanine ligase A [Lachnospiraceae bacterium]
PSAAGSSRGVTKAHSREELLTALYEAARHDSKILIEETIVGREIECAVFSSGDELIVSGVGEIVAAAEFYDYDAKYNSEDSETDTHPVLPEGVEDEIRKDAAAVFRAVDAYGLSRVDFFFDGKEVIFNEINSIPGFTPISMYPMLFGAAGIGIEELVEKLAESAKKRPHRTEEGIL